MKVTVDRRRLRARMIEEDKNSLIRALKADDPKAAKQALTGMNGEDLGLTHKEFGELTTLIDASSGEMDSPLGGNELKHARQILGIQGKDTKQSTATHNPVTGQPWSSGPTKQVPQQRAQQRGKVPSFLKLTPAEENILSQYSDKPLNSMTYEKLIHLSDVLQSDVSAGRVDTSGDSLLVKISDMARTVYPHKYKDADFPDI